MISNKLIDEIVSQINVDITHISIGTGVEAIPSDLVLDGEQIRKQATSYIDDNAIIKELYLDETEGNNMKFTNVGVYGDNNTNLFAGGKIDIEKNSNESMTISVEITVERV